MKFKIMGLRSLKTIIAVLVSYIVSLFFGGLNPAMLSAASITAVNSSIFDSFRSSFDRVSMNIVAVIVAFLLQALDLVNPIGVTIGMTIIILICNFFKAQYAIGSCAIYFVFVLQVPYENQNLEVYAFNRIMDTIIGSAIGLLVNTFVFRPRQEKYLLMTYRTAYLHLRNGFKDLLEEDKSVDEFKLIDDISQINHSSNKLKKDILLKMNENINTVTVSKLNNLFRTALSLIIELNELDEYPTITEKNNDLLNRFFKGDFESAFKIGKAENEYDNRYNYELTKIVHTMESIEFNLNEFQKMYNRSKEKWYMERK